MGPSSSWTRRRASTPRPPGGARTARPRPRPPAPGHRRLADPFAPSEETKYTFVSHRARVRVLRRTVAGRRVRGPRARLASSGRQPLRGPGVPRRKWAAACGRAGLTSLPPRAGHEGRPEPAPTPARPRRFARRRRGLCTSLSGFSAGREAGEREPQGWTCESGPQDWGLRLGRAAFDSPATPSSPGAPPLSLRGHVLGRLWDSGSRAPARPQRRALGVLQVPAGPAPRAPKREARPGLTPAQCGRPSLLVPHPREGPRGGRSIRGIKASEGA